jgi:hypothetical protein
LIKRESIVAEAKIFNLDVVDRKVGFKADYLDRVMTSVFSDREADLNIDLGIDFIAAPARLLPVILERLEAAGVQIESVSTIAPALPGLRDVNDATRSIKERSFASQTRRREASSAQMSV